MQSPRSKTDRQEDVSSVGLEKQLSEKKKKTRKLSHVLSIWSGDPGGPGILEV